MFLKAFNSSLFFAGWCYQPSLECTKTCRGMCRRDTGIYSPCFRRYHCWWDRNLTTTSLPITSTTPLPMTSTAKPKITNGQIFGWTALVITVLVAAAVGLYFVVKRCRGRRNRGEPVVTYTSRWRFSWPDYPMYYSLVFNLPFLLFSKCTFWTSFKFFSNFFFDPF